MKRALLLLLLLAGCPKKSSSPPPDEPQPAAPDAGAAAEPASGDISCADAIDRAIALYRAELEAQYADAPPEERADMEAQWAQATAAIRDDGIAECEERPWSAAEKQCVMDAPDFEAAETCVP